MKRNATMIAALLLASAGFSQQLVGTLATESQVSSSAAKSSVKKKDKATGDILWKTNFDYSVNWKSKTTSTDGPAPDFQFTIDNDTNAKTWAFTKATATTRFNSTSKGNVAYCENGNPQTGTQRTSEEFILELDSSFNFATIANPLFTFQQFGARFFDNQVVEASIDGGITWNEIGNNLDRDPLTSAGGSRYPNPENRSYSVAAAFPSGTVFADLRFRFRVYWGATQPGIMYGWYVDDIQIIEGPALEVEATKLYLDNVTTGFESTKYPRIYAKDYNLTLQMVVQNNGGVRPNNLKMKYDIINSANTVVKTGTGGVQAQGFANGPIDTVTFVTGYNLGALPVGTYKVLATISGATDEIPTNDTVSRTLTITPNFFSQSIDGEPLSRGTFQINATRLSKSIEVGSIFYNANDSKIEGFQMLAINDGTSATTAGEVLNVKLYEIDLTASTVATFYNLQAPIREFTVPSITGLQYMNFYFDSTSTGDKGAISLLGNKYYMFVAEHFGGQDKGLTWIYSATDDDNSARIFGDLNNTGSAQWFTIGGQFEYNLLTASSSASLKENKATAVAAYPNPTTNQLWVAADAKIDAVVITSVTGQVIYSNNSVNGMNLELNTSDWANGIYTIQVSTNGSVKTTKVVKN